jgi:CPA1 family monovalent cation:H+ antiporter
VRASATSEDVPEPVHRAAQLQYEGYLAAQGALDELRSRPVEETALEADYAQTLEDLLRQASEVERGVVLEARRSGDVSPEAADEALSDIEARAIRDLS